MTDAQYKQTKLKIQKLIKKWYKPAGFGWWRTDFNYSSERKPNDDQVAAETHADFKYSHASITFYMPVLCTFGDEELESTFVHELCHLTASTYPNFDDNPDAVARFERTVDDFARHIIWAAEHVKGEDNARPHEKLAFDIKFRQLGAEGFKGYHNIWTPQGIEPNQILEIPLNPKGTEYVRVKLTKAVDGKPRMTGQKWYNRFVKELRKPEANLDITPRNEDDGESSDRFYRTSGQADFYREVLEAARKASGL